MGADLLSQARAAVWMIAQPLVVGTIGAAVVLMIQRRPVVRRRILLRPLRREAKTKAERKSATALGSALSDTDRQSTGADVIGAAMLSSAEIADRRQVARNTQLIRSLTRSGAHGLVSNLMFRDDELSLKRAAELSLDAIEPFERAEPLADSVVTNGRAFANWVTERTGAPVLLDSLNSRSRVADDVLVWHRPVFKGHPHADGDTYEDAHRTSCPAAVEVQRPGDYDARVLHLDACAYVEDSSNGSLSFVLETSETCYAATEQGSHGWGCKHLPPLDADEIEMSFTGCSRLERRGSRLCLLTSYVALISSDRQLVLCRRSDQVRSGRSVVSASAGGVCEPGDSRVGDRNKHGWPDPLQSAKRELREELGIDVDRDQLRPAALFLANSKNRRDHDHGQLVACVLSIARTDTESADIHERLWTASDLSSGRFEVDDLVALPLDQGLAGLIAACGPLWPELDQHGVMSILYTSALLWGRRQTQEAFDDFALSIPPSERIDRCLVQQRYLNPDLLLDLQEVAESR